MESKDKEGRRDKERGLGSHTRITEASKIFSSYGSCELSLLP